MTGPLVGVRVIDLTDESAALSTRILADLGADVIRVEPPEGCRLRHLEPFYADVPGIERSVHHRYLDAGKRSVVLDRMQPVGGRQLEELVATADVLVECERLADGPIRQHNPELIHATVTSFGLEGPWSAWRGNDLVCGAASGLTWVCGRPGDPPNQPGGDQANNMAGLAAAQGVVTALWGRRQRGGGVHFEVSVQEAAALTTLQTSWPANWVWNGEMAQRPGLTTVHQCADGRWATLMVRPNRLEVFADWCQEIGLEVPADRAELLDAFGGTTPLASLVRQVVSRYPRDELYERAWALDIMGLPVQTLPEIAECEQFLATGQFLEIVDEVMGETLSMPRSPVDPVPGVEVRRAPGLGEHTADVLQELGSEPPRRAARAEPAPRLELAKALDGVRVVDFCWVLAGPLGTRHLADFGAEVIRIESGARAFPEQFPKGHKGDFTVGAFHNLVNTGKRSITVDPRTPRGRELILELIEGAEVVTNNYTPGAMDEMGFSDDVLRAANPKIIIVHMPGCGAGGPWAGRGTYGNMISAAAGISALTGFGGRSPRGMGVAYPDFAAPLLLAAEVTAALRRRESTGEGCTIQLDQLQATFSLIGPMWLAYTGTGKPPAPRANRDPNWCPHGVYPTAGDDEWIALAADSDDQWGGLCALIGRQELATDDRFRTHGARREHEDELDAILRDWTATRDKWETAERLQAIGVAAAPVENLADALERDPHLSVRHFQMVRQPSAPDIDIPVHGEPVQEVGRWRPVTPAPVYGSDTNAVLGELLGLTAEEIDVLRQERVIT